MIVANLTNKEIVLETGEIIDITKFIQYKYSLGVGCDIDEETIAEIKYEVALEEILKYAVKYQKTVKEADMKLRDWGYDKNIRQRVEDKIEQEKYIDEYEIALEYIETKDFGDDKIRYDLSFKGIKRDIIELAFENRKRTEEEKIDKLLKKVRGKEKRKQIDFLASRGFSFDNIIEKIGGDYDEY